MAAKLLQGLGVLALLGLVGGSFAALVLVRQRVHVTIADEEEASQHGPDPLDLVRADLAELKGDLRALSEGLGSGLESLQESLESADAEREQALRAEVRALREQTAALQTRVEALAAIAARAASTIESPGTQPVAVPESAPAAPIAEAPAETHVELGAPPAAETGSKKKSFLSFQLPSDSFAFDQPMRLEIVPSLSRVGFDAKSTLHDFSGISSKVTGEVTACLARPEQACKGEVRVEAASLATGEADRDDEMRRVLAVEASPLLRFEWEAFALESLDAKAQKLSGTARGRMTIHGTTRELSMPVRISVDASKRVAIEGEAKLLLSSYGVAPPTKLGLIKVEDEVKIWISLRARSLGTVRGENQ